ncbi:thioesterase II family protein [Actinoplanes awajinensis]|uniref:Thioesterase domain-containing protein n=1 Tax=Actinoplanes awajinensis subsp. mycoplanecinus TaxID=135947 RepID=A0A101JFD9_9ACTN|nr:alpha/beta fold hydrolase [Actinoplanes awajinensis]KUL25805.1 hypothetical protein ADL15_39535 [Actinoplanes awajinensis subsp. mycoplanecinus]
MRATDWFIPLSAPDRASAHVYAFPQAGGGATAFAPLADALGPEVGVWALNLPGRRARFGEPPRTDLDALLGELANHVPQRASAVLFGYCSGALLAYLLAARMHRAGRGLPAGLVVASYPAPDRAEPAPAPPHHARRGVLGRNPVLRRHSRRRGVPADFREIFEPALRADYELLADYRYRDVPALPLPITAVVGTTDAVLRADDVGRRAEGSGQSRSRPA